jgi:hypothetical protein
MGTGRVRALCLRVDRLYAKTLKGGHDDNDAWDAVAALRRSGSRLVFDHAANWCSSSNPLKRSRASAVLGQLRATGWERSESTKPKWMFRDESFRLVVQMLGEEKDSYAISAEIAALGFLDNLAAVPLITRFATHENEDVRFSVAFALGNYHEDAESIRTLLKLMDDTDRHVRDWATFGLGVLGNADSEELRSAFLRKLEDDFLDARIEAAASLGKRHDARLARPLVRMLKKHGALNGLAEAAQSLLKMEEDPLNWFAAEYIREIENRFQLQSEASV